ncbi:hypothetical protein SUGI_0802500 [Cryptomeria japonica]|nr:hypothetical protein SUGI_0802500 [Cryptomeria japonica]
MALMASSSLPALSKTNGAAMKPSVKIAPRRSPSTLVRQRTDKSFGQTGHRSRASVCAQYNNNRGGVGDFVGGFFVGGLVFGALGYLLAPQISKNLWAEEAVKKKVLKLIDDGEEGLEIIPCYEWKSYDPEICYIVLMPSTTNLHLLTRLMKVARKSLSEKIAQLNSAIDGISDKLKADKGVKLPKNIIREGQPVDYI